MAVFTQWLVTKIIVSIIALRAKRLILWSIFNVLFNLPPEIETSHAHAPNLSQPLLVF